MRKGKINIKVPEKTLEGTHEHRKLKKSMGLLELYFLMPEAECYIGLSM